MREFLIEQGHERLPFVGSATLNETARGVADRIRRTLGFDQGWAAGQATWTDAFRALRDAMEATGILVMVNGVVGNNTHRKLDPNEFRGFVLVDDCNHDIDGLFAKSFERQMAKLFGGEALKKLPKDHAIYRSFFKFDGPPATSFELNGWGDDLVHDYLKGIEVGGRLGVLYSNKDYGCEWDYDWRNKRFLREDNTKFAVNIVVYVMA